MILTLLHTSAVHIPVFDALRDACHPELTLRHVVREDLLERAGRTGPESVADDVRELLEAAAGGGADAVLCTCSSIGAVAERQAAAVGVATLRVDRPMAARAVAEGSRVVVVASARSTLAPTVALVEEEAARAGRQVVVRTVLVADAWERFTAGDRDGYLDLVAAAVDAVTDADADTDVIVLAQASMADAADRTRNTAVPVLSSPRPGLAAAAAGRRGGPPRPGPDPADGAGDHRA
ncbi:aspartate/glutamate racemase family protein [Streptomyces beihaiensis]|uniref:Aspartate/glutamate racemase family protein n=1 Tax=Streptomyces beihaiensis TaxID=2984495 RepID=A0ABT3U2J3_9ACTN|nr:aspartate/glutamate racemase family protein [Streptomyces beihaiensis]MCX3063501.1 aspartate/glutamate racemase family protein [Streptomyces beihaiensis]